ncbi:hypothetical protein JTE90_000863 [Oedothorax gibbosus]|uniref:Uncharacterized protein n=1 Tax=Oedothorax gibbosus TaxID=931172 RepID=A0AAV6VSY5_9ARAC|nr:hypothetical protein JTE90_000863 [Oedothorax gibbosus]
MQDRSQVSELAEKYTVPDRVNDDSILDYGLYLKDCEQRLNQTLSFLGKYVSTVISFERSTGVCTVY